MPSITFRVSDGLYRSLKHQAEARGQKLSAFIRDELTHDVALPTQDYDEQLEGLERRLARLEEMAGL